MSKVSLLLKGKTKLIEVILFSTTSGFSIED